MYLIVSILHTKACPNGDFGARKDTFFIVITNLKVASFLRINRRSRGSVQEYPVQYQFLP